MRIQYINYLNIFSCISVIALHCNGCFWNFSYDRWWKTSVIIETAFYTAVPVFFMIIGVTLLDYHRKYDTKTFFKKRVLKTLIPFIVWSLFAIGLQICLGKIPFSSISIAKIVEWIISNKYMPVYWFFISLFATYLSLPILGRIEDRYKKEVYSYGVIGAFLTMSFFPQVLSFLGINYNAGLNIEAVGGYLIYVLLGYLIEYCYKFTMKQRILIYILGFCGWFTRFITVLLWSLESGSIQNQLGGYIGFPTVLFSVAVFVFFKYEVSSIRILNSINYKHINLLASYSLGVYLIHMYFVIFLPKVVGIPITSMVWRTAGVIIVYCCCLITVFIMKRIPLVKYIVP